MSPTQIENWFVDLISIWFIYILCRASWYVMVMFWRQKPTTRKNFSTKEKFHQGEWLCFVQTRTTHDLTRMMVRLHYRPQCHIRYHIQQPFCWSSIDGYPDGCHIDGYRSNMALGFPRTKWSFEFENYAKWWTFHGWLPESMYQVLVEESWWKHPILFLLVKVKHCVEPRLDRETIWAHPRGINRCPNCSPWFTHGSSVTGLLVKGESSRNSLVSAIFGLTNYSNLARLMDQPKNIPCSWKLLRNLTVGEIIWRCPKMGVPQIIQN